MFKKIIYLFRKLLSWFKFKKIMPYSEIDYNKLTSLLDTIFKQASKKVINVSPEFTEIGLGEEVDFKGKLKYTLALKTHGTIKIYFQIESRKNKTVGLYIGDSLNISMEYIDFYYIIHSILNSYLNSLSKSTIDSLTYSLLK